MPFELAAQADLEADEDTITLPELDEIDPNSLDEKQQLWYAEQRRKRLAAAVQRDQATRARLAQEQNIRSSRAGLAAVAGEPGQDESLLGQLRRQRGEESPNLAFMQPTRLPQDTHGIEVPYYSKFAREQIQPAVGELVQTGLEAATSGPAAPYAVARDVVKKAGGPNLPSLSVLDVAGHVGGPRVTEDVARPVGEMLVPVTGEEIALEALGSAGELGKVGKVARKALTPAAEAAVAAARRARAESAGLAEELGVGAGELGGGKIPGRTGQQYGGETRAQQIERNRKLSQGPIKSKAEQRRERFAKGEYEHQLDAPLPRDTFTGMDDYTLDYDRIAADTGIAPDLDDKIAALKTHRDNVASDAAFKRADADLARLEVQQRFRDALREGGPAKAFDDVLGEIADKPKKLFRVNSYDEAAAEEANRLWLEVYDNAFEGKAYLIEKGAAPPAAAADELTLSGQQATGPKARGDTPGLFTEPIDTSGRVTQRAEMGGMRDEGFRGEQGGTQARAFTPEEAGQTGQVGLEDAATVSKPGDIVHRAQGDEMEIRVRHNDDGRFGVTQFDNETGQNIPGARLFNSRDDAIQYADELASKSLGVRDNSPPITPAAAPSPRPRTPEVAQPTAGRPVTFKDPAGKNVRAKTLLLPGYQGPPLATTTSKGETFVWLSDAGQIVGHSRDPQTAYRMAVNNVQQLTDAGRLPTRAPQEPVSAPTPPRSEPSAEPASPPALPPEEPPSDIPGLEASLTPEGAAQVRQRAAEQRPTGLRQAPEAAGPRVRGGGSQPPTAAPGPAAPADDFGEGAIIERPQTPLEARMGRHTLEHPGGRIEWRESVDGSGAHIQDVVVRSEKQGVGMALVYRALDDITAKFGPRAEVTADLASEKGARLIGKIPGVQLTTREGENITPEVAAQLAAGHQGPQAVFTAGALKAPPPRPTGTVTRSTGEVVQATPEEIATAIERVLTRSTAPPLTTDDPAEVFENLIDLLESAKTRGGRRVFDGVDRAAIEDAVTQFGDRLEVVETPGGPRPHKRVRLRSGGLKAAIKQEEDLLRGADVVDDEGDVIEMGGRSLDDIAEQRAQRRAEREAGAQAYADAQPTPARPPEMTQEEYDALLASRRSNIREGPLTPERQYGTNQVELGTVPPVQNVEPPPPMSWDKRVAMSKAGRDDLLVNLPKPPDTPDAAAARTAAKTARQKRAQSLAAAADEAAPPKPPEMTQDEYEQALADIRSRRNQNARTWPVGWTRERIDNYNRLERSATGEATGMNPTFNLGGADAPPPPPPKEPPKGPHGGKQQGFGGFEPKTPLWEVIGRNAWETLAFLTSRSLQTMGDVSALLRQGGVLVRHQKEFLPNFVKALRGSVDEAYATRRMAELNNAPFNPRTLEITDLDGANLTKREEDFISRWSNKLPILKQSQRFQTLFLNGLRSDIANTFARTQLRHGVDQFDPRFIDDMDIYGNYLNRVTGRGNLGGLEDSVGLLNQVFYSARRNIGMVQAPAYMFSRSAQVRKEAMLDFVSFFTTGMVTLNLAQQAGAEVGINPLEADFGKIQVGNTRVDLFGGYQQMARMVYRVVDGQIKDPASLAFTGPTSQFLRNKLSPLASGVVDVYAGGKNAIGEPLGKQGAISKAIGDATGIGTDLGKLPNEVLKRLSPLAWEGLLEAIEEEGLSVGGGLGLLGTAGAGVQSYTSTDDARLEEAKKLGLESFEQADYGQRKAISDKLRERGITRPSEISKAAEKERTEIAAEVKGYTDAWKAGQQTEAIQDRWHDAGQRRLGSAKVVGNFLEEQGIEPTSDFAKRFETLITDYRGDDTMVKDQFGQIDWGKTIANQESFVKKLDDTAGKKGEPSDRKLFQSYLEYNESLKTPEEREFKAYNEKREKLGYFDDSLDRAALQRRRDELDKKNPDVEVDTFRFYGGFKDKEAHPEPTFSSAEAINKALALKLPNRPVKMANVARPVNQSAKSQEAWKASQAVFKKLDDGVNSNLDAEANRLYGTTEKPVRFADVKDPQLQSRIRSNIKTSLRTNTPQLDAWLAYWGEGGANSYTLRSQAAVDELGKLIRQYGSEPPKKGYTIKVSANAR